MAVKVAVVAAAGTRTDAGTVMAEVRLLTRATVEPPVGAGLDKVTVQEVVPEGARAVVPHTREVSEVFASSDRLAVAVTPLRVPVTVAA